MFGISENATQLLQHCHHEKNRPGCLRKMNFLAVLSGADDQLWSFASLLFIYGTRLFFAENEPLCLQHCC